MSGGIPPTWTWGSSARIQMSPTLGFVISAQLAQVTLPEPAVCSLYFQAVITRADPGSSVSAFTLNLLQGIGRVTIPRQVSFAGQPSPLGPLEWTMPFVPVHALQVDCEASLDGSGEVDLQIYMLISPITRIPMDGKLEFGMQLPGEADALDDELRTDLEDESPTTQEVMSQEANQRVHGDAGGDDAGDEDADDDAPQQVPAWMLELVDALSQRLGRVPTRKELRGAVTRMRERAARKGR